MINLTNREYEKQRRKGMRTTEGYVYINPRNRKKIIKVIEPQPRVSEYLGIKQHTIKLLLENKEYLEDIKIANPQEDIEIDMIPRGYEASNIKGLILSSTLEKEDIPLDTRIDYLKQVGNILRKMSEIRQKNPHLSNFYYNDIHENNFIVNNEGIVYGIDLDSCSIQDNAPIQGLYSLHLSRIPGLNQKYPRCNQVCECTTSIIPNENLDLYCYNMMILNFMYGRSFAYSWNPKKLDIYLNILESCGANLELLYALSYIYDNKENNINPEYLLDYIKEIYQYSNFYQDKSGKLSKVLR